MASPPPAQSTHARLDAMEEGMAAVRHELAGIAGFLQDFLAHRQDVIIEEVPLDEINPVPETVNDAADRENPRIPAAPEARIVAPNGECTGQGTDPPVGVPPLQVTGNPEGPTLPAASLPPAEATGEAQDPREQPGVAFLLPPPEDTSTSCPQEVIDFLERAWSLEGRGVRCRRPKGTSTLKLPFLQAPTLDREILTFGAGRSFPVNQARDKRLQQVQESILELLEPLATLLSAAVERPPPKASVAAAVTRATAIVARTNGLLIKERREGALAAFPDTMRSLVPGLPEPSGDDSSRLFGRQFLAVLQDNAALLRSLDSAVEAGQKRPAQEGSFPAKRPRPYQYRQQPRQPFPGGPPTSQAGRGRGFNCQSGAGRIARCFSKWLALSQDPWVLQVVQGYRLDLVGSPVLRQSPPRPSLSKAQSLLVKQEIDLLLSKGAISPTARENVKFLSPIFLVPKKDGGSRPVLNLRNLNRFIRYEHFKMEGWHTVKSLIHQNDFLTRIDLQDAYLSVPIHAEHRPLLCFEWGPQCYQWNVLPFGLSSAPRVFTKLLKPVVALFRSRGVRLVIYLDDILLLHQKPEDLVTITQELGTVLTALGFQVNLAKSHTTPCQCLRFLGFLINTQTMRVSLPPEKIESLSNLLRTTLSKQVASARDLSRLIGKLNATVLAVFPAPLHFRALQHLHSLILAQGSWDFPVPLSADASEELRWWVENIPRCRGRHLIEAPIVRVIQTDSSSTRWGAVCAGESIGNLWGPLERLMHINELELKAAFLGLQAFGKDLHEGCLLIQTDNTATVAAINKLGSARSLTLSTIARELWSWCFQQGISVRAEHLPGRLNTQADWASRHSLDSSSWRLLPQVFSQLQQLWGPFAVDLFADYTNHQLPTFYSWKPDPQASGTDAFTKEWSGAPKYAFPPFALIGSIHPESSRSDEAPPRHRCKSWALPAQESPKLRLSTKRIDGGGGSASTSGSFTVEAVQLFPKKANMASRPAFGFTVEAVQLFPKKANMASRPAFESL
ncbi:uncharacterized protein LOC135395635 [Ornithodoros turicata]|uniref:uncharacterized protein LOC135395635 n=1 Tax=Ornithodoros turicata TaxID=34597 RepID=UPI003139D8F7